MDDSGDGFNINKFIQGVEKGRRLKSNTDRKLIDCIDKPNFWKSSSSKQILSRYDLEKTIDNDRKRGLEEIDRYWVNKPFSFVSICRSSVDNEIKYFLVEPYLNEKEEETVEFLSEKLKTSIRYGDEIENEKNQTVEEIVYELLDRYNLYDDPNSYLSKILTSLRIVDSSAQLSERQVKKVLYYLKRDFVGYGRIDGLTKDINVEDISCDGYNSPVFVYHTEYEQILTNIKHGEEELDNFVVELAQRAGKGLSKRNPQVDATLPNGSRAQLTLGNEVSDHGTNYTIRQFKEIPFTPIDLINWNTFSLNQIAFLWLAIENNQSIMFAGGTASGKTTSLNAVSLFIPSDSKIVSIEDTREVELPQRNWIASVTRPAFTGGDKGEVDEFELLESALRQRPDYIIMGEVRGEEGRTLFQVMSTGHTTYTTFHADSVEEVLKRFTTDPINVSKTLFTALDIVSIQTQTTIEGKKIRRNKKMTEVVNYEPENDEITVKDIYRWNPDTDEFTGPQTDTSLQNPRVLDEIRSSNGWSYEQLNNELLERRLVLAYLIKSGLNSYSDVAATIQAYINSPDKVIKLIAENRLEDELDNLRQIESVHIDTSDDGEESVPRPEASDEQIRRANEIILSEGSHILNQACDSETPRIIEEIPDQVKDSIRNIEVR